LKAIKDKRKKKEKKRRNDEKEERKKPERNTMAANTSIQLISHSTLNAAIE
jgi:hypothetical protein